jgi:hypothetical protein
MFVFSLSRSKDKFNIFWQGKNEVEKWVYNKTRLEFFHLKNVSRGIFQGDAFQNMFVHPNCTIWKVFYPEMQHYFFATSKLN